MNQTTYFSGGRFEGLIDIFKNRPGVLDVVGGLCLTKEGQRESILVKYDDEIINYEKLVSQFIKNIDLTDGNGQFDDRGNTYLSTCYYQSEAESAVAKQVIEKTGKHFKEIFVKLLPFKAFEAYDIDSRCETLLCIKKHQAKIKSEMRYEKIAAIWRGTYHEKLKTLSPLAFEVTKNSHTERPYTSDFVTNSKKGIYVDIISNEPLFSSLDQFDAGCGWPSFTKPITKLLEKKDTTYGMHRIEIRSIHSDAHLGHVFDDGPLEKGGLRYCINGASLKFIAYDDLEKEGFKAYEALFK